MHPKLRNKREILISFINKCVPTCHFDVLPGGHGGLPRSVVDETQFTKVSPLMNLVDL